MIEYTVNGCAVTRLEALKTVVVGAAKQGYDIEEAMSIFHRAETLEGEEARDMLFTYHDGVELFVDE